MVGNVETNSQRELSRNCFLCWVPKNNSHHSHPDNSRHFKVDLFKFRHTNAPA